MKQSLFDGVTTALITPFLSNGDVDFDGLRKNVHFQIENGVKGLLPIGTTGEAPTLSPEETETIVKIVVEEASRAGKESPVMVGVGTNSTRKTVENAKKAQDWGVDALLVVTPYYNKPTQAGIEAHFAAVSAAVDIPIVVYNIQGRTGTNITTATLKNIATDEKVIAVKEASGDIHQMVDVINEIPDIRVYSGDDSLALPLICLGGHGVISVVSNLLPRLVVKMAEAALRGDIAVARQLHYQLLPIFKGAFVESNPSPIKYAMNKYGLAAGSLRLPLVEPGSGSRDLLDQVVALYTS